MEKSVELVFIPVPGITHLISSMEFAKLLVRRDDRIRITIEPLTFVAEQSEYVKSVAASEPRIQFIDLPPIDPPSPEILAKSPESFFTLFMESYVPSARDALRRIVSDSVRVTGLIVDFFCVSMIDAADELGLPAYIFLTCNAAYLNLMLYLPNRHSQLATEFTESDLELPIPGFSNLVPPQALPRALFCKNGGYEAYIKLARRFRDTKGIIVNTFAELESHAVGCFSDGQFQSENQNPPVYTVGPMLDLVGRAHPVTDRTSQDKLVQWLDNQPPASVVFLCFGTKGSFGVPQIKEIAHALERSGYRFLWVIRDPKPATEMLPEGIGGRGVICGWAPQMEVLAHKAVGGFVSHCGWSSILESLWNRVPIATWPLYAEQQLNAFVMVKELGGLAVQMQLGSRIAGDLVSADEIESAVRRLMDVDAEESQRNRDYSEEGFDGRWVFLCFNPTAHRRYCRQKVILLPLLFCLILCLTCN